MSQCYMWQCHNVTSDNVRWLHVKMSAFGVEVPSAANQTIQHFLTLLCVVLLRQKETNINGLKTWVYLLRKAILWTLLSWPPKGGVLGPREPEEWLWNKKSHGMKWSSTWSPALSVQFSVSLHWKFKVTSHWGQAWTETSDSVKRNVRMRMDISCWSPFLVEAFAP